MKIVMLTCPLNFNVALAWSWILLGFISGMVIGLNFHREDWLGGYTSRRRRLYRLGHISFFGLAAINLLFVFTLQLAGLPGSGIAGTIRTASVAFLVGTVTMPLCCLVAAHNPDARALFAVPVTSLLIGGACTLWEVIQL